MRGAIALGVLLSIGVRASSQELWTFGEPNRVYGIYRRVPEPDNPLNFIETRIGHIDAKRTETTFQGKLCVLFSTTAYFSPKPIAKGIVPPPTVRRYDVWMTKDGTPLRVFMQTTGFRKVSAADAIFKDDSIEMTITESGKSRQTTLYPSDGVKAFVNPFLGMMATADKERGWVNFSCLEAYTNGIYKYKARVVGKFKHNVSSTLKFEGRMFEVVGPEKEQTYTLYITNEGMLIQVDLPDGAFITAQDFPMLPASGKSKGGGTK